MKKLALLAAAVLYATPALATVILPGTPPPGLPPAPFVGPHGTLLATLSAPGTGLTFSATMTSAVYLNLSGTLDFYYQVRRTGAGSTGASDPIGSFTAAPFGTFLVDAFEDPTAFDIFAASTNGIDTSTVSRSNSGDVLTVNFGINDLTDSEISPVFIFRTNATNFRSGTYGILDGSSIQGTAFAPAAAVPEPATWAMMLIGFGGIGMAIRRRRRPALGQIA